MKNWILTLCLALGACGLSFGAFYWVNREPAELRAVAREGDAMEWLRLEFQLNEDQFAAIKQLHEDYGVICAQHCSAIMAAEQRGAPKGEIARLENHCVQSMGEHFHRVAALMSPVQGQRYLAVVLPRINDYSHRGAPNVRAEP